MPHSTTIRFSYNWNNKLGCKAFTTLRLNNGKYEAEKVYDIYLDEKGKDPKYLGKARCVRTKVFVLEQVNDFIAYLDTGYNAQECWNIIRRMYKKDNPEMVLVLLLWVKRSEEQPKLPQV